MEFQETTLREFQALLQENKEVMREMLQYLKKQDSDWCDPDEAAELLGFRITKSGHHRRKVSWLAKQGFIERFREGSPWSYWREDVKTVSIRLAKGEIYMPGTF